MSRNIIEVDPDKFPWLDLRRYTFSMAAETNGVVYLSGQTARYYDPNEKKVVCKGDLVAQTKLIYEKLGVLLEAAGLGFHNIVQTVDYIDPLALSEFRQTADVRREYLGDTPVASTGICVERLLLPGALIEISAVAMRDEKRAINPGWERYKRLTYVPGVEAGDTIWLSGITGTESVEGKRHYPQDMARQADLCYQTIGEVLKTAGAGAGDIVKCLDYIPAQALLHYGDTEAVRRDFYGGQYPASSGVPINRLLRPEPYVEVETMAVKGGSRQEIRIPEWEHGDDPLTYVPGVKKGGFIHVSGQGGIDHETGESIGKFDIVAQTEKAYSNIAQILAAAGYSMDDVVNTVEWVSPTGLSGYRGVQEVRRKYFGDKFPSSTGVLVHQNLRPELLIEVMAVALV